MTHKVKNFFENDFPDSSTGHRITFRGQNWWKSTVAKLPKSPMDYHTKNTRAPRESSQLQFCQKWVDRAQNSVNVVTPSPVHVYRIWSQSAAFCRTYSRKVDFSAQKVNTIRLSAYNKFPFSKLLLLSEYVRLRAKHILCLVLLLAFYSEWNFSRNITFFLVIMHRNERTWHHHRVRSSAY